MQFKKCLKDTATRPVVLPYVAKLSHRIRLVLKKFGVAIVIWPPLNCPACMRPPIEPHAQNRSAK